MTCKSTVAELEGILILFARFDSISDCSYSIRYSTLITLTRGEINLDAEEIKETKLIQEETEMIEVCLLLCGIYILLTSYVTY